MLRSWYWQVLSKGRFHSFMSGMWSHKTVPNQKSKISAKLQEVSSWTSAPERIPTSQAFAYHATNLFNKNVWLPTSKARFGKLQKSSGMDTQETYSSNGVNQTNKVFTWVASSSCSHTKQRNTKCDLNVTVEKVQTSECLWICAVN